MTWRMGMYKQIQLQIGLLPMANRCYLQQLSSWRWLLCTAWGHPGSLQIPFDHAVSAYTWWVLCDVWILLGDMEKHRNFCSLFCSVFIFFFPNAVEDEWDLKQYPRNRKFRLNQGLADVVHAVKLQPLQHYEVSCTGCSHVVSQEHG